MLKIHLLWGRDDLLYHLKKNTALNSSHLLSETKEKCGKTESFSNIMVNK